MDKYDKALEYEIFVKKEYGFADEQIKNAKVIFDIGGHKGLFSKYCFSLNPGCKIHYFEPIPELYKQAQQELKNQNIVLNNIGIAEETGEQKLYYNSEKTMQSSIFNQTFLNPKGKEIVVRMKNLEEYCKEQQLNAIDFLKMDVEGMEYEIIESLSKDFFQKIKTMILEYHCFSEQMEENLKKFEKKLAIYYDVKTFSNNYDGRLGYFYCV